MAFSLLLKQKAGFSRLIAEEVTRGGVGPRPFRSRNMVLAKRLTLGILVVPMVLWTAPAWAEGYVQPFGGAVSGGSADKTTGVFGATLGGISDSGLLGFEIEFADAPHFFGNANESFSSNNELTLSGNLLIGPHLGSGARIYATAGLGLMKGRVESADQFFDVSRNDFGFNVGGGLWGYLGGPVGLRGDVRFFRSLHDPKPNDPFDIAFGRFQYWRVTGGIMLRF
jgi:hypothetical protein